VKNQIYTVSDWSQKTETRIAPTVNRKKDRGKPWNEREVNAGSTKSATHHGQKSPAANEGKTLFKTAGAIVLWIKNNERHRLVDTLGKGGTVQNQIYTVSDWSQKTETRIAPTVNRKKNRGKLWNEREVNSGLTKSATHHGQKRPAVNEGKTLFKNAGAIVLWIKNNERHRLVGAEKNWKRKTNQPKAVRADRKLQNHHEPGKGAPR